MTDEGYVKLRVSLIKEAEAHANTVAGLEPAEKAKKKPWAALWNRAFSQRMDLLVKEKVLEDEIKRLAQVVDNYRNTLRDKTDQLGAVKTALACQNVWPGWCVIRHG